MNIYDIAQQAGVSIATVSRVLNGSEKVSPRTRAKVLEVIESSGYTPNIFAQGLGVGTIHAVGILVPDISDLFMADSVAFLEQALKENGYSSLLATSGFDRESKERHVQMLLSKKVDALILVGSTYAGAGLDPEETEYIRRAAEQVPVFLVNGHVQGENIFSCVCDDFGAMYNVTSRLLQRGRRRILFMTDSGSYSALQKTEGYRQALRDAGLPVDPSLMLRVRNRIHQVRDLLLEKTANADPAAVTAAGSAADPGDSAGAVGAPLTFDAVIATDDGMAVGAVKYAAARGLRVPEDLEIVGYNNSSLSVACEPELTSIDNLLSEMCETTVHRLHQYLSGDHDQPQEVRLGWRLVERGTTR